MPSTESATHPVLTSDATASIRWPTVSVIVPTRNRAVSLADTLRALVGQIYPRRSLEIVVVDNSSTDDTEGVVRAFQRESPFPLRYFRKDDRGPAVARNYGAARATGEILGFTDSDCAMEPDWVRNAVRCMASGVGLVSGPVHPVIHPRRIPGFFYHQTDHRRPNVLFPTANVFYRRVLFEELGGFDEQFGAYPWGTPVGGEDIDLAWRMKRAGHRSAWAGDAPVFHVASDLSARSWLLEPIRSQIMPRMVALIPELRTELFARYFVSREHFAFDLALIGTVVAFVTRRRAAFALALPWLWLLRPMVDRDVWPPTRWWRMPLKYALSAARHLVGTIALVVASVRYRRLVL